MDAEPRKSKRGLPSAIFKRSIKIEGCNTSLSLEQALWNSLKDIAEGQGMSVHKLVAQIDRDRHHGNLSSALRVFVLEHYRKLAEKR